MVVSKTLREYYRSQYRRETIYVPNGASAVTHRSPRQLIEWGLLPDNYVLFLGRFSPEKNCHLLIEAFENIQSTMKLVLAGGSSHSDSYVENLRSHESDRIRFLPWVSGSNLEELLSHAALFVLPSELEGLSLALLDAMAAGVCVLTSDIPENCEVVDGAGYTFRRGNRSDLERMLDLLVHNSELRHQAAARGQERIRTNIAGVRLQPRLRGSTTMYSVGIRLRRFIGIKKFELNPSRHHSPPTAWTEAVGDANHRSRACFRPANLLLPCASKTLFRERFCLESKRRPYRLNLSAAIRHERYHPGHWRRWLHWLQISFSSGSPQSPLA